MPLCEVAELIPGATPPRQPAHYGGDIPLFRLGDLGEAGPLRAARDGVTELGARCGRLLPPGTVLVSCIGVLGKVGILGCPGLTNQQITALVPRPGIVPEYLYYWAQTLRPFLVQNASATTLPIVNKRRLGQARFPLRPLAEQHRIVATLQAAEARHARAAAALADVPALLCQLRRALRERALHGAELVPLRSVARVQVGYAFRSSWFAPHGVRLLRGVNVAPGAVTWGQTVHLPESLAAAYGAFALQPGDLVIGLDRPIISSGLRAARIAAADLPALLVQRVGRLILREGAGVDPDYLLLSLHSEPVIQHLLRRVTGTQLPHLRPADLTAAPLPLPSLAAQRLIVKETAAAWHHVAAAAAEAESAKTRLADLWRTLLDRTFPGELPGQLIDDRSRPGESNRFGEESDENARITLLQR